MIEPTITCGNPTTWTARPNHWSSLCQFERKRIYTGSSIPLSRTGKNDIDFLKKLYKNLKKNLEHSWIILPEITESLVHFGHAHNTVPSVSSFSASKLRAYIFFSFLPRFKIKILPILNREREFSICCKQTVDVYWNSLVSRNIV